MRWRIFIYWAMNKLMSNWIDALFGFLDGDRSQQVPVDELVRGCMPDTANVWDCTGAGACVKVTLTEAQRRRVGAQGALRYLMQLLAMDATEGTATLADDAISLPELRVHATQPFYELCGLSGDTAHVRPEYEGYLVEATDLLAAAGYGAEAASLRAQMAPQ